MEYYPFVLFSPRVLLDMGSSSKTTSASDSGATRLWVGSHQRRAAAEDTNTRREHWVPPHTNQPLKHTGQRTWAKVVAKPTSTKRHHATFSQPPAPVQPAKHAPISAIPSKKGMQAAISAAVSAALAPTTTQLTSLQAEFAAIWNMDTGPNDLGSSDVEIEDADAEYPFVSNPKPRGVRKFCVKK